MLTVTMFFLVLFMRVKHSHIVLRLLPIRKLMIGDVCTRIYFIGEATIRFDFHMSDAIR